MNRDIRAATAGAIVGGTGLASVALAARFGARVAPAGAMLRLGAVTSLLGAGVGAVATVAAAHRGIVSDHEADARTHRSLVWAGRAGIGSAAAVSALYLGVGAIVGHRAMLTDPKFAYWGTRFVTGTAVPATALMGAAALAIPSTW